MCIFRFQRLINKIFYIALHVLFILHLSCSTNKLAGKIIEQSGDVSLKTQKIVKKGFYVGYSQSDIDYEEAFKNAINSAQAMIARELGINISIHLTDISTVIGSKLIEEDAYYSQQEIKIESEHYLQTRINRIYHERSLIKDTIFDRVWVELFFDVDSFFAGYHDFWISANETFKNNIDMIAGLNGTFIYQLERILALKSKFDEDKKYLSDKIIRDFEGIYGHFLNTFTANARNIEVTEIGGNVKFSNKFEFKIRDTNKDLIEFPVSINRANYTTNRQGLINYIADFNDEIVILLGHDLYKYFDSQSLIIYHNDSFSPLFNRNITLKINSRTEALRNTFTRLCEKRGYRIGDRYDLLLELSPIEHTQRISVNQYITDLKLRIDIKDSNNKVVQTINLPHNQNDYIKGYGQTESEARTNAYNMEWFGRLEGELSRLEQSMVNILIR